MVEKVLCLSTHLVLHKPLIFFLRDAVGQVDRLCVPKIAVSSVNFENRDRLVDNCQTCSAQLVFYMKYRLLNANLYTSRWGTHRCCGILCLSFAVLNLNFMFVEDSQYAGGNILTSYPFKEVEVEQTLVFYRLLLKVG